jgi:hypothetical protein
MAAPRESAEVRNAVRATVRALLEDTPAFARVTADERKALANKLVHVGLMAARLAEHDETLTRAIGERAPQTPDATPVAHAQSHAPIAHAQAHTPVAQAQTASDQLGMAAVRSAGNTIQNLKDSVAFPEFVQSLITGTFQAILTSSVAQLGSLGELLDSVAATSEEFDATVQDGEVRQWALARFPFLTLSEGAVVMRDPDQNIADYTAQLTGALSASADEVAGIDGSDLETTLLPLVRRKIGRDKQGILATLVKMGLQRIVVDEGRLEASMDLRVDAQSQSQETQAALDSLAVNAGAAANMSFGPVGASAYASTSIGRVRSDVQQTAEQIAARAGLRSSVQLAFRTEQVPLDRMANEGARVRIGQNARVPDVAEHSILNPLQNLAPIGTAPPTPPPPPNAPPPQSPTQPRPPTPNQPPPNQPGATAPRPPNQPPPNQPPPNQPPPNQPPPNQPPPNQPGATAPRPPNQPPNQPPPNQPPPNQPPPNQPPSNPQATNPQVASQPPRPPAAGPQPPGATQQQPVPIPGMPAAPGLPTIA